MPAFGEHDARVVSQTKILQRKTMTSRTTYTGLVDTKYLDQIVTLTGWVHRRRDHGGVIFVDLRDREGIAQVVIDPDRPDAFKLAETLRNEFCIRVTGKVRARPEGTTNKECRKHGGFHPYNRGHWGEQDRHRQDDGYDDWQDGDAHARVCCLRDGRVWWSNRAECRRAWGQETYNKSCRRNW